MNPFRYPEAQHIRTQAPDLFSDYRQYKPFLRIEFGKRCVYCLLPDGLKGPEAFGVDHYRPVSRFPGSACEYSNLFYACNVCNWRKGDFWPDTWQWTEGHFIPNPCDHQMSRHLRFERARVEPRTPAGRFTVEALALNDPEDVQYREFLLRSIERCQRQERAVVDLLDNLEDRLSGASGKERDSMIAERVVLEAELASLRSDLERLTGSPPS